MFLADWSGKVYDKNNQEHVAAKNYIINSLGTKTQYWSNQLTRIIPGMDIFNWRMWGQKGWEDGPEGKIRVARFKHYTWGRIYRKGDAEKDIFFTVGVDNLSMELVKKYKISRLKHMGHFDLADQVDIVKDGKGYDVLSFDENRKPKYIEVKTTIGSSLVPFDYTINEKLFAEQHSGAYFIYRLYNYNEENNTADFFIIDDLEASILMQPVTFKGYIKKLKPLAL